MIVRTSQIRYKGNDRLDITVKSGNKAFAPTWDMVRGVKSGTMSQSVYAVAYINMLNKSYIFNKVEWDKLLSMDQVTLVCYCPSNTFCHRILLAKYLVDKFGADYVGEVSVK